MSRIFITATLAPSFTNKIQVSRPIHNTPLVIISTLYYALFMSEFVIMNAIHKINCLKKEEVTELLKRFTLFTFLESNTPASETLHPSSCSP